MSDEPRESGWMSWHDDCRGTTHLRVTLTDLDARRMDRVQLAMLTDAAELIEAAFAPETPAAIEEHRASRDRPRRVAELSPDELRGLLTRMQSAS